MFGSLLHAAWRRVGRHALLATTSCVALIACATPRQVVEPGSKTCAGEVCVDNTAILGANAVNCGTAEDPSNYPMHHDAESGRARRCALSAQKRGIPFSYSLHETDIFPSASITHTVLIGSRGGKVFVQSGVWSECDGTDNIVQFIARCDGLKVERDGRVSKENCNHDEKLLLVASPVSFESAK